ncbi:hypothetical protein HY970_03215 [Candidatus Kaiserbacteria bacterium]|nr:hypothetical protein [Candidatus Kaiserbacteria bacterium]
MVTSRQSKSNQQRVKAMEAIVFGFGNIGKALVKRLNNDGWEIRGIVRRDGGLYDSDGNRTDDFHMNNLRSSLVRGSKTCVAFIAIPSDEGGDIERKYIQGALSAGAFAVTCAKSALSNHHEQLKHSIESGRLGYRATVGGGTHMLPILKKKIGGRKDVAVCVVVNGTLNFLFHSMHHDGDSLGMAIKKAERLRFVEPGATNNLEVINGEMQDTKKKTVIVGNTSLPLPVMLNAAGIQVATLDDNQLARLVRQAAVRRYLVRYYPAGWKVNGEDDDVIGGFTVKMPDGAMIQAGFHRTDLDPVYTDRLPLGANNFAMTIEGPDGEDGIYVVANGPGAGPEATTAAMMADARQMLGL